MDNIRIGFAGMGPRGRHWLSNIQRLGSIEIIAVCEKTGPLLEAALASVQGEVKGYRDFSTMLKDGGVDAVVIVVEPENNPDLVCEALESGKHVLCEVPLAYTVRDCWRVVLAAEKAGTRGIKFAMAEQVRYSPYILEWKKMVDNGSLGRVLFAEGQYLHGRTDNRYWHDGETGEKITWEQARSRPNARKSRAWSMPHPILYLPHELSPILKVLSDRVTRVTCMATRQGSYINEDFPVSDLEVALMHTEKDAVMRMLTAFAAPTPSPTHWHHIMGTKGCVETNRSTKDSMKMWLAESHLKSKVDVEWENTSYQPAPPGAKGSGHGNLDYYPADDFITSIIEDRSPELDVYGAAETAAPAIIAGVSAENGSIPLSVPDFRPSESRAPGEEPPVMDPSPSDLSSGSGV